MRILAILVLVGSLALPALAQNDAGPGRPYLDDRTNAAMVISSYYNAINRHEYARAWSYWHDGVPGQTYDAFVNGYARTETVEISLGAPHTEGAAGSIYTAEPVAISATSTDGTVTAYAGCFLLRLVEPTIQEPPFTPLHIEKARLKKIGGDYRNAVPESCDF